MEAVGGDDDVYMIIVGDEDQQQNEENLELADDVSVEKEEEFLELIADVSVDIKEDLGENEESDEGSIELHGKKKPKRAGKRLTKSTVTHPKKEVTFINTLRLKNPKLRKNEELLIEALCDKMMEIKRPEPPKNKIRSKNKKFQCVDCKAVLVTQPAAERHWQEKHGDCYLECYACGYTFRSTTSLYRHEKRCLERDAVLVLKARARILGRKGRSRPFLQNVSIPKPKPLVKKEKRRFHCPVCTSSFSCNATLKYHMNLHRGERPYRCSECPAAYISNSALYKHQAKHTGVQYICDHCGRTFKLKYALVVHLETHKPVRKYVCDDCGTRFASNMALRLHVDRVHKKLPAPCPCQICLRRFPRMTVLRLHMIRKHGMQIITKRMYANTLPMLPDEQVKRTCVTMQFIEKDARERPETVKEEEMEDSEDLRTIEEEHESLDGIDEEQNETIGSIDEPQNENLDSIHKEENENLDSNNEEQTENLDSNNEEQNEEEYEHQEICQYGNAEEIEAVENLPKELYKQIQKLKKASVKNNKRYVVFHKGIAISVDGNVIDLYKNK